MIDKAGYLCSTFGLDVSLLCSPCEETLASYKNFCRHHAYLLALQFWTSCHVRPMYFSSVLAGVPQDVYADEVIETLQALFPQLERVVMLDAVKECDQREL